MTGMTAQLPDTVRYEGQDYDLTGINGDGLFEPLDHGMRPFGQHSECERGYVANYAVKGGRLLLEEVDINLRGEAPLLHGVVPSGLASDGDNITCRFRTTAAF